MSGQIPAGILPQGQNTIAAAGRAHQIVGHRGGSLRSS